MDVKDGRERKDTRGQEGEGRPEGAAEGLFPLATPHDGGRAHAASGKHTGGGTLVGEA